jgi:nucleoside-diphosphate-sugar epimerase
VAIADTLDRGEGRGQAFNAGGGKPHPVRQVIELIARLAGTGVEPEITGTGSPAGEIDRQCVDASKLREATGWEPQIGLEDGLRRTIEWYRHHPEARAPAPAQG